MDLTPCEFCGHPAAVHLAKIEPGVKHPFHCSLCPCERTYETKKEA